MSDENELYFCFRWTIKFLGGYTSCIKMEEDGTFKEIHNVGAPVNGKNDDFAQSIHKQN
jgi:hypothetical protein